MFTYPNLTSKALKFFVPLGRRGLGRWNRQQGQNRRRTPGRSYQEGCFSGALPNLT